MSKINAIITGVGGYVPDYVLNNDELSRMLEHLLSGEDVRGVGRGSVSFLYLLFVLYIFRQGIWKPGRPCPVQIGRVRIQSYSSVG